MQFQFEQDFYPDIFKSKTFELSGKLGLHRYAMLVYVNFKENKFVDLSRSRLMLSLWDRDW